MKKKEVDLLMGLIGAMMFLKDASDCNNEVLIKKYRELSGEIYKKLVD